jgi:uncharacterized protein involved in exopolysaccharide biosynthesis
MGLLEFLWRSRWWLLLAGLAGGLIGGSASFLIDKQYRSSIVFSVVTDDDSSVLGRISRQIPIAALSGFIGNTRGRSREEALALLRSRTFNQAFIARRNLAPALFKDRWDAEAKQWKAGEDPPTDWELYKLFDRKVRKITEDRVSGMVTVSVTWTDARVARDWARAFVKDADEAIRVRQSEEANRSIEYLQSEIGKTTMLDLRQSLFALLEEQYKRAMLTRVKADYVFSVVDPPVVPDRREFVSPNRIAMAIVFSLLLAAIVLGILLLRALGPKRARTRG